MDVSWGAFVLAGGAGFGLGIGLMTGAAVVSWLRFLAADDDEEP